MIFYCSTLFNNVFEFIKLLGSDAESVMVSLSRMSILWEKSLTNVKFIDIFLDRRQNCLKYMHNCPIICSHNILPYTGT